MNTLLKVSALTVSSLLLAACGSSSDSDSHSDDVHAEHAHSLLISQANSDALSVLEEGQAESLTDTAAANGAQLLLADSGEAAAVITSGSVQFVFVHEEHDEEEAEHDESEAHDEEEELPELSALQIDGANPKVVNSNGHFSVLLNGTTQFIPYAVLENAAPEAEAVAYAVTETYPALLLHEDETRGLLTLVFDGTNAVVYEGDEATANTTPCATVNSTAHVSEFAVVSCTNGENSTTFSVKAEENTTTGEHEAEITTIAGIATAVEWQSRAGVFVGLGADNKFYVLEENANEALEVEGTAFAKPDGLCQWGIDTLEADIFALTATALRVYNHEGEQVVSLTLDETTNATCDDVTMAAASQAVFVLDNSAQKLYEIDKEDGATLYHIHGREDVSVNDVKAAVNFHEIGSQATHDH